MKNEDNSALTFECFSIARAKILLISGQYCEKIGKIDFKGFQ